MVRWSKPTNLGNQMNKEQSPKEHAAIVLLYFKIAKPFPDYSIQFQALHFKKNLTPFKRGWPSAKGT